MSATAESLSDAAAAALLEDVLLPEELGSEQAGDEIGAYRLIEKLGEGGFGIVWQAEQLQPVRREVALKLLKLGMDSRQVLARFEQERRVLAAMEHPGIARWFDAGIASDGRPFFVMELVRGVALTAFCAERALPLRQRIALLREVCLGVQHAHQKGVIHRDLKPSNILVTEVDGHPVPKIIDFGIAKALATDRMAAITLSLQADVILGTPQYMSPEQIADLGSVDTRSDIYALGALMYELLTGSPPFDAQKLRTAGAQEMRRMVRELRPKRPSTCLSTRRLAALPAAGMADRTRLPADLDWITLRALEKEPSRRYQSAAEFAADLQRFLDDEPVSAHPPSNAYLASRWIRRHRAAFAAACVSVLALVTGAGVAIWQATIAHEAQLRAESESARSRQTADFLTGLLAEVAEEVKLGRNPEALRLALISSQKRIDALDSDPDLQIALMTEVVGLFEGMSDRKLVIPALRQRADMIAKRHGPDSAEERKAEFEHLQMMVDHGSRIEAPELLVALRSRIEQHEGRGSDHWFRAQQLLTRVWIKLRRGDNAVAVAAAAVAEARTQQLDGVRLEAVRMNHVDALEVAREFEAAEAQVEACRAIASLDSPEHDLVIDQRLVYLNSSRGDHVRAAEILDGIIHRLQDQEKPILTYLVWQAEEDLRGRNRHAAIKHAHQAIVRARRLAAAADQEGERADTLRELLVKALGIQAAAHSALNQHDKAVPLAQEALVVARQDGNLTVLSRALDTLAQVEEATGNYEAAWEAQQQNYELHTTHNASYKNQLEDLRQMSRIRLLQQRPVEALKHARDAWKQTLAERSSRLEPDHLAYMAKFALKIWQAASAADPTMLPPKEFAAWEDAVRNEPANSQP